MILKPYKEHGGIKIFNEGILDNQNDYNPKGLDNLYKVEEKHFWFISRKEFIFNQIKNFIKTSSNIIEIGAGTGNVARYLIKKGYNNISVGEMHLNGLKYAQEYGIQSCYQFNLLHSPFKNEFEVICMFDVLEHIKEDELALSNIHHALEKNGYLVITVPAHMWLWNRDDSIAGHKRRYTKKILHDKLMNNHFEVIKSRYFFISIVPLLLLRSLLNKDDKSDITEEEYKKAITINPIINTILLTITKVENKLNKFLPNIFGGSLFIIARKI